MKKITEIINSLILVTALGLTTAHAEQQLCDVDVDGNGQVDALTDGLITIRYLFGLTQDALVADALGAGATRNAQQIATFLATDDCKRMMDIDANATPDALTDGLLLIRELFGLTNLALTQDAVAPNATRGNAESIKSFIAFYKNQREVSVSSDALLPGERVSDSFQDFIVKNKGTTPASVSVVKGEDENGQPYFSITGSGNVEIQLPDLDVIRPTEDQLLQRTTTEETTVCNDPNSVTGWSAGWCHWHSFDDYFVRHGNLEGRLPFGTKVINSTTSDVGTQFEYNLLFQEAAQLISVCSESVTECFKTRTPVLFIHGLSPITGQNLGGGEDTWNKLPLLLQGDPVFQLGITPGQTGYNPFIFRWKTDARYQDVSRNLYSAIKYLALKTGKSVQVIGHSLGGVLIRSMLQQIGDPGDDLFSSGSNSDEQLKIFKDLDTYIASVITIGAPLSGIADKHSSDMHGVRFPRGQALEADGFFDLFHEYCRQITCQQTGEGITHFIDDVHLYKFKTEKGWLVSRLSKTKDRLPAVDILTLIGLTSDTGFNSEMDDGDKLISFYGQRFDPSYTGYDNVPIFPDVNFNLQVATIEFGGAKITERILGYSNLTSNGASFSSLPMDAALSPGDSNPRDAEGFTGYRHSPGSDPVAQEPRQAFLNICSDVEIREEPIGNCHAETIDENGTVTRLHGTLLELKAWYSDPEHQSTPVVPIETLRMRFNVVDGFGQVVPELTRFEVRNIALGNIVKAGIVIDGVGTFDLPFDSNQQFKLIVKNGNYRTATKEFITEQEITDTISNLNDIVMVSNIPLAFPETSITITDSITGSPVSGVDYSIRRIDHQSADAVGTTDSNGQLSINNLAPGSYKLVASRDGYETISDFSLSITTTRQLMLSMSPILIGDGTTSRVSVASDGSQGNNASINTSVSADGRYIAFSSNASNLVANDTNGRRDIFVHDRQTGITQRVSVASDGSQADNGSFSPSLSANGRYIAFSSDALNLVANDTNATDVFVHDRQTGITEQVSVASDGSQANHASTSPSLSADGRYITFLSFAWNLVANDTYGETDVFVRDRQTGITQKVSVASDGSQANSSSSNPSVSANGRYIAFESSASNLVTDNNNAYEIFIHDRQTGITQMVSVASDGSQANSSSFNPIMSADGRYIAFESDASNLVSNDTNGHGDIFVHDRQTGITQRVSVASDGTQANWSSLDPSMSVDGQYIVFESGASNLVANDFGFFDIYIHDRQTGITEKVSVASDGSQANRHSLDPSVSTDGQYIVFVSGASNLVANDTNDDRDIFVREMVQN